MFAPRLATIPLLALAAGVAQPALAQVSEGAVLSIMRECARIDDPSSRLACYDNNIRSGEATRSTVPGQVRVEGGPGMVMGNSGVTGFGREDVRQPQRAGSMRGSTADEITATVSTVQRRGPGLYAFTLEDGAQWVFAESVAPTYSPPRNGSRVELIRGAMDSFLMRFDNQPTVRVRRVQ